MLTYPDSVCLAMAASATPAPAPWPPPPAPPAAAATPAAPATAAAGPASTTSATTSGGVPAHPAPAAGGLQMAPRRFVADVQPNRRKRAACRACHVSFEPGMLRVAPRAKASCGGGWFTHAECVHEGLRTEDTVEFTGEVPQDQQLLLRQLGARASTAPLNPGQPGTSGDVAMELSPGSSDASAAAAAPATPAPTLVGKVGPMRSGKTAQPPLVGRRRSPQAA